MFWVFEVAYIASVHCLFLPVCFCYGQSMICDFITMQLWTVFQTWYMYISECIYTNVFRNVDFLWLFNLIFSYCVTDVWYGNRAATIDTDFGSKQANLLYIHKKSCLNV